jgi:hypothetical protein
MQILDHNKVFLRKKVIVGDKIFKAFKNNEYLIWGRCCRVTILGEFSPTYLVIIYIGQFYRKSRPNICEYYEGKGFL